MKISRLFCFVLVALMTVSMLPTFTAFANSPNPTGEEIAFRLELTRAGASELDLLVDVYMYLGGDWHGVDGLDLKLTWPRVAGLQYVSTTRYAARNLDAAFPPLASGSSGPFDLTIAANTANWDGISAGHLATVTFRLPSEPTTATDFDFSIVTGDAPACAWNGFEGQVISGAWSTASVRIGPDAPTPVITSITGNPNNITAATTSGTATFTIAGTDLDFTNGTTTEFTANPSTGEFIITPGAFTIANATPTGATLQMAYTVPSNETTASRNASITVSGRGQTSSTAAVITQAGAADTTPSIPSTGGATPVGGANQAPMANNATSGSVTFTITGSNLQGPPQIAAANFAAAWAQTEGTGWVANPTIASVVVNSNTSATVTVNFAATDNSAGTLRSGDITLSFNGTTVGTVTVNQSGNTPTGSIEVATVETAPGTTGTVDVGVSLPVNPGVRNMEMRLVIPEGLVVTGLVDTATNWPDDSGVGVHEGVWEYNIPGTIAAGMGGNISVLFAGTGDLTASPTPLFSLLVNGAGLTETGGPLGDGVYPIQLAFVDRLGNPIAPQQGGGLGTDIDLAVTNGAIIIRDDVVLIGDVDSNGRLTSRDVTLIAMYVQDVSNVTVGTPLSNGGHFNIAAANTGCLIPAASFTEANINLARATLLAQYLVGQWISHGNSWDSTRMCSHAVGTCTVGIRGDGTTFGCDLE